LRTEYCQRPDEHDFKGYAECFTEDGTMQFEEWGQVKGRAAIERAASVERAFEGLQHSITNVQLEVDGSDTATGRANLMFFATPSVSKPEVNYAFGGPYQFKYRRTSEGWRLTSMKLRKVWAQGEDTTGSFTAKAA
jgi:3-phenylpropionate/cinnamic acid dioxygenase small subunit